MITKYLSIGIEDVEFIALPALIIFDNYLWLSILVDEYEYEYVMNVCLKFALVKS